MPIIKLDISLDTDESSVIDKLKASPINGKGQNEVFHSLDALKVWRDWFEPRYGRLINVDHHSNPDDPPDLTLHFANADLRLEHTELKPHPFGMFDAIHHKECPDQCVTVPSLTKRPTSRDEITSAMFNFEADAWVDSAEERQAWAKELRLSVERKLKNEKSDVLLIQGTALRNTGDLIELAVDLDSAIRHTQIALNGRTVLLHSRHNSVQYASFRFHKAHPMERRIKDA